MTRFTLVACALVLAAPAPAQAQVFLGAPRIVDGDSLEIGAERIRLFGIDAVELAQTCARDGMHWACGAEAKALLETFVARGNLRCVPVARDVYGRSVSRCTAGDIDLGRAMIEAGMAVALEDGGEDYAEAQAFARAGRFGIWASQFQMPADYRAANPRGDAELERWRDARQRREQTIAQQAKRADTRVYFRNCAAARAAGAAPMGRDHPGYRPGLDGDNDGIACEPYRRR